MYVYVSGRVFIVCVCEGIHGQAHTNMLVKARLSLTHTQKKNFNYLNNLVSNRFSAISRSTYDLPEIHQIPSIFMRTLGH